MLPTFPYTAMTITGMLHVFMGATILLFASVGFAMNADKMVGTPQYGRYDVHQVFEVYLGLVLGCSSWIIMVGILGIVTGIKYADHKRTQCLKIAYMVTAILSAILFSWAGLGLFSVVRQKSGAFNTIGILGGIACFANFVLAMVSSSICCCCADSNPTGVEILSYNNN